MKRRKVTVTSKNQITIPADLVRKYNLDQNSIMTVSERDGSIVLSPLPSLRERMKEHWDYFQRTHPDYKPLTDEQIHTQARDTYIAKFEEENRDSSK